MTIWIELTFLSSIIFDTVSANSDEVVSFQISIFFVLSVACKDLCSNLIARVMAEYCGFNFRTILSHPKCEAILSVAETCWTLLISSLEHIVHKSCSKLDTFKTGTRMWAFFAALLWNTLSHSWQSRKKLSWIQLQIIMYQY